MYFTHKQVLNFGLRMSFTCGEGRPESPLRPLFRPCSPSIVCIYPYGNVLTRFFPSSGQDDHHQAAEHCWDWVSPCRGPVPPTITLSCSRIFLYSYNYASPLQVLLHDKEKPLLHPTQARVQEVRPRREAACVVHRAEDKAWKVITHMLSSHVAFSLRPAPLSTRICSLAVVAHAFFC